MLICGGCKAEIPEKEAVYLQIAGEKILKPCKSCREKWKKKIDEYPKLQQWRNKTKEKP